MNQLDRVPASGRDGITHCWPRETELIFDFVNRCAGGVNEPDSFAPGMQDGNAGRIKWAEDAADGEFGLEKGRVLRHDDKCTGGDVRRREHEAQSLVEGPSCQVHRPRPRIIEFDELRRLGFYVRVVVDFVDDYGGR